MSDGARVGAMNAGGMMTQFERAKRRYASGARSYSPLEAEALRIVEQLERTALEAVYAENEQGGHARQVVAGVARVLGVDIDEGEGHRWDPDHMGRVVDGAQSLSDDRDHWQQEAENERRQAELWKSLAERQDNTAPVRMKLSATERERDQLKRDVECLRYTVEVLQERPSDEDVEELKATIVRLAREITRLTEGTE